MDSVRIDKWLWAVRLYKTRSQATNACKLGQVTVQGQTAKPSRAISVGETIIFERNALTRTVRVVALLEKRVGAKLVDDFMEDVTPEEEFERARREREERRRNRVVDPGAGRPTKKKRRRIRSFLDDVEKASRLDEK